MDPGEYRTNVLSFNNFASINYEYLELQGASPNIARKHLQKVEAAWRQEGKLVQCDAIRDGLWLFRNNGVPNASTASPKDDYGYTMDTSVVETQGMRLVAKEKGIFEPASLVRNRQATLNAINAPSNNSSPSSSLENTFRNAQSFNTRTVQANTSQSSLQDPPTLSPGLKGPARLDEVWPSMKDVHESFISAVLGSIVYLLCRDEGFVPLNPRTLIMNCSKPSSPVGLAGNSLQAANSITLATLDISLTSLGTLVIKAHSDVATSLQSLVSPSGSVDLTTKLTPGTTLWLAPGGNTAKFYCAQGDRSLPEGPSTTQVQASASDPRLGNLNSATIKAWQSKCLEWLSSKGINTAAVESGGWLFVQVGNHSPYLNTEYQGIPILDGLSIVPWPIILCFQNSTSRSHGTSAWDQPSSGTRDPLAFAEGWFTGKDERASLLLKRQKERQKAEALSRQQADVEARALQSNIYSSAVLRRGSNAGAMYPTPPDAIHHPIGATPSFDGAASTPGLPTMFISQDTGVAAPVTSGVAETDMDLWGSAGKKERIPSNANFAENDNDAENIFVDIGGDIFGTDITDADFNFFDEPDNVQPEPKLDFQEPPNCNPIHESVSVPTAPGINGKVTILSSDVDTVMQNDNQRAESPVEKALQSSRMDVDQIERSSVPSKRVEKQEASPPTKSSGVKSNPPFDQRAIFERLIGDSRVDKSRSQPRRASLFDKVDFEKSLSLVDQKYGAHGQYKFSANKHSTKRIEASELPQTEYLAARKKAQTNEHDASIIARILVQEKIVEKPQSTEPMNFFIDSDSVSQVSEQDDTSHTTDDASSMPKMTLDRDWRGDIEQGDIITTSFDPMAIDYEPSTSTPQSATTSQMPLLDADPAVWSLTTYFTSPEPETQSSILSDLERIATAQILADQAISGTLQLPRISDNETPSCKNKTTATRGLIRSLTKAAKSYFADISACTMRSFLEIPGIPVLNQGLRLPPRPMNPRTANSLDPGRPNNPFSIPPPQLEVRRSDSKLSILPPAVKFWENLGLSPAKGGKDVLSVCVYPNIDGLSTSANTFLEQIKSTYESYKFGSHERAVSNDIVEGLLSFPYDSDRLNVLHHMTALQDTVARLSRTLSSLTVEEKNFVVYFVYPVDNAALLVHICSAFQHLFNLFRKALMDRKTKTSNELVLQLIPMDFIASFTFIPVPLPSEYARLAMEIYDRCIDFTSSSSSPAVMLEQPLPKSIDFKLNSNPSASLLQENTCLHIAYAQSIDDRWITAVWTDNRGTQQMTASYCLGRKNEPISMHFSEVANEIWETTLDFISTKKIHWRIMIARVGVMDPSEIDFWTGLASTESDALINLTLLTVQTDPSLRLLPPPITLTANGNQAQSVTPVSTPQAPNSIVSPDNNTSTPNPMNNTNAATPTAADAPLEPDSDARLLDLTDQSWGCILAHRLNNSNSLLEVNPALISGYLLKRTGSHISNPPSVIEVNIVHCEVAGNPRTFHEGLLREVLGIYRGLATLAKVRGVTCGNGEGAGDGRPWHIAAAEKAVKALYLLM